MTTVHGEVDELPDPIYRQLAGTTGIICVSDAQRRSMSDLRGRAVIHHGLDVDDFPFGTGSDDYAMFLGRMAPEKRRRHHAVRDAGR